MQKSVALCTFNGEKYLHEQIDSILKQSTEVQEIVICDDLSTDKTFAILTEYRDLYPKLFKIHQNEKNLGYVKNFEKTILLCSGDLIFLCDQDDIWFKDKVRKIEKVFLENNNINVLCHNIALLGEKFNNENYWKIRGFDCKETNYEIIEMLLLSGNIFPGMSMVINKKSQQKYFPLKKINHLIIHDYELILQSCRENSFFVYNEILGNYRIHENQNIGFEESDPNKKITANSIYTRRNSFDYIKKLVAEFHLDSKITEKYKKYFDDYLDDYLKQFSYYKRLWMKIKIKYYYKIK